MAAVKNHRQPKLSVGGKELISNDIFKILWLFNKNVSESVYKQRFGILLTPLSSSSKYMQIT